jgi:hypothetical protein
MSQFLKSYLSYYFVNSEFAHTYNISHKLTLIRASPTVLHMGPCKKIVPTYKFSYLLCSHPTNETKMGGRLIIANYLDQWETASSRQIIFSTLFSGMCCVLLRLLTEQKCWPKLFCWAKPACFDFSSSDFIWGSHTEHLWNCSNAPIPPPRWQHLAKLAGDTSYPDFYDLLGLFLNAIWFPIPVYPSMPWRTMCTLIKIS